MDHLVPTLRGDAAAPPSPLVAERICAEGRRPVRGLGAGDSVWMPAFLSADAAAEALARLAPGGEVAYQQWYHMPDRKHADRPLRPLRRIKAAMAVGADADGWIPHYRFPVNDQQRYGVTSPMTPLVDQLRGLAEAAAETAFNHAVVLCYRDGSDAIGLHKDKMLDLDPAAPIFTISLGASRSWLLRDDIHRPTRASELVLTSGSAFLLGPQTNLEFYHSIPQDLLATGMRISVTFRRAATFRRLDGTLRGQGAAHPGLNWPTTLRGAHRIGEAS